MTAPPQYSFFAAYKDDPDYTFVDPARGEANAEFSFTVSVYRVSALNWELSKILIIFCRYRVSQKARTSRTLSTTASAIST